MLLEIFPVGKRTLPPLVLFVCRPALGPFWCCVGDASVHSVVFVSSA